MDVYPRNLIKSKKSCLSSGFTLVELMITVAVIQILAAIAAPFYADYLKKTKWVENINIAQGVSKQALTCLNIYGSSCTGVTGYIVPRDIGLSEWPTGRYISFFDVFFDGGDGGFHVVIVGTAEVGGYRYDRGYSKQPGGGYSATKSYRDTMPTYMMRDWPQDSF